MPVRQWLRRYPISSVLTLSVLLHLLLGWLIVVPFNFITDSRLVEQPPLAVPIQIKIIETAALLPQPVQSEPKPPIPSKPRVLPSQPANPPQLSLKSADDPAVLAAQNQLPDDQPPAADAVLDSASDSATDDFVFDFDAPEPDYPPPIDAWDRDLTEADSLSFQQSDAPLTPERMLTEQFARGALPQQIKSIHQAEVMGIDFELRQVWTLNDQQQYRITSQAEKFGFNVEAVSTGQIGESGLVPNQFEILVNQREHAWAMFDARKGLIRYGTPTTQSVGWLSGAQDLNSVFFQLALLQQSIADRQLQVAAVNQVHAVDLKYRERRPTRLPTGVLLTDVLTASDGQGQFSGEVRFAPALGNYPVAIRVKYGRFEVKLSLQRLDMNGVTVWGR